MNGPVTVTAKLNMRLMPVSRGSAFEDPLDDRLKELGLGQVNGGGTAMQANGEVAYCDIEIELQSLNEDTIKVVLETLSNLGAAKGSSLRVDANRSIPFGELEGLAIYLNGRDLPAEVYASSDVNVVYSSLDQCVDGMGMVFSYWEGPTETALYLYGRTFGEMKSAIQEFVSEYPLCQQCRIEQIA
ncbi:MAG: hypothetical protein JST12_02365 [Armatimonadetes bacterium]|nr:hypothetical protein [Armatimonadota bacterium]